MPEQQKQRPAMVHYVKSWPEAFREVKAGGKTAEFRLNDRDYRVGDTIVHQEYDLERDMFTGNEVSTPITHAVYGPAFGVPAGFVMMSTPSQGAIDVPAVLGHPGFEGIVRTPKGWGATVRYATSSSGLELCGKWQDYPTPPELIEVVAKGIREFEELNGVAAADVEDKHQRAQVPVQAASTLERLRAVFEAQDYDPADVVETAKLADDLAMDSLDVIEMVMAVEQEFDILIPDENAETLFDGTVGDLLRYIEQATGKAVNQ